MGECANEWRDAEHIFELDKVSRRNWPSGDRCARTMRNRACTKPSTLYVLVDGGEGGDPPPTPEFTGVGRRRPWRRPLFLFLLPSGPAACSSSAAAPLCTPGASASPHNRRGLGGGTTRLPPTAVRTSLGEAAWRRPAGGTRCWSTGGSLSRLNSQAKGHHPPSKATCSPTTMANAVLARASSILLVRIES
jgi:hypothetical protein